MTAAGREDEALKAYRVVLADDDVQSSVRAKAEEAIKALGVK